LSHDENILSYLSKDSDLLDNILEVSLIYGKFYKINNKAVN